MLSDGLSEFAENYLGFGLRGCLAGVFAELLDSALGITWHTGTVAEEGQSGTYRKTPKPPCVFRLGEKPSPSTD